MDRARPLLYKPLSLSQSGRRAATPHRIQPTARVSLPMQFDWNTRRSEPSPGEVVLRSDCSHPAPALWRRATRSRVRTLAPDIKEQPRRDTDSRPVSLDLRNCGEEISLRLAALDQMVGHHDVHHVDGAPFRHVAADATAACRMTAQTSKAFQSRSVTAAANAVIVGRRFGSAIERLMRIVAGHAGQRTAAL